MNLIDEGKPKVENTANPEENTNQSSSKDSSEVIMESKDNSQVLVELNSSSEVLSESKHNENDIIELDDEEEEEEDDIGIIISEGNTQSNSSESVLECLDGEVELISDDSVDLIEKRKHGNSDDENDVLSKKRRL